jgi:hypothetical protein
MPKFSQIPTNNSPVLGDYIVGVSAAGVDQKTPLSKVLSVLNLDFRDASASTWSFSSYSSTTHLGVITVPSDATLTYRRGMWITITQATGGVKYGMITAVTSTTLTINFFGYTLNNEAITVQGYSPLAAPYGTPVLPYVWTEGNGWTVKDYGVERQILRQGSFTGAAVAAAAFGTRQPGINYPVGYGMTDMQATKVTSNDQALSANIDGGSPSAISFCVSNQYNGGGVTPTIYFYFDVRVIL